MNSSFVSTFIKNFCFVYFMMFYTLLIVGMFFPDLLYNIIVFLVVPGFICFILIVISLVITFIKRIFNK